MENDKDIQHDEFGDPIHKVYGNLKHGANYENYLFDKSSDEGDLVFLSSMYDTSGYYGYIHGRVSYDRVIFKPVKSVGTPPNFKSFITCNPKNIYPSRHAASWEHVHGNGKCQGACELSDDGDDGQPNNATRNIAVAVFIMFALVLALVAYQVVGNILR